MDRVTLDGAEQSLQIALRLLDAIGVGLASPGGFEPPYLP